MSTPQFARHWHTWGTPHFPAISSTLIFSRAWAHSLGVKVFLHTLTTPNLFCKVDSVCFLHRRSLVLQLEVCMAHTHHMLSPGNCSFNLTSCLLALRPLLFFSRPNCSNTAWAHCLGGLKCKVECQPHRDTRMCQAIHFLIPCWFFPVGLDISRAEGRNLKNDHSRLTANTAQIKIT
jgi:hypothetical protein